MAGEIEPEPNDPVDEQAALEVDDDELLTDPTDEADSESDEETSDEDEQQAAVPAPKAESRGNRQFGALREQNRRNADENARLTRELHELRQQVQRQQAVEDPRVEAERVALMSPEERLTHNFNKALQRQEQQNQTLARQLYDQSDRAAFNAYCATNRIATKFASEVERQLATLRAQGHNVERMVLLKVAIGDRVLQQQGSAQQQARANQRKQAARPVAGRSDTGSGRRERHEGPDALERRLANVQI